MGSIAPPIRQTGIVECSYLKELVKYLSALEGSARLPSPVRVTLYEETTESRQKIQSVWIQPIDD